MTAIERQAGIAEGIDQAAELADEALDLKQLLERLELGLTVALGLVAQSERNGAMMAVDAVLEFVASVPGWERRDLGGPLWQLLTALKDLDFGRVGSDACAKPRSSQSQAGRGDEKDRQSLCAALRQYALPVRLERERRAQYRC